MPDIIPNNSINIDDELKNLSLYKYHPNGIMNVALNRLTDMLDGKVTIVDPSNPFIYLLETSCLNTAFSIQEMTLLTRKLYPRLANSEEDLYLHMSDADYIGRFAEPAYGNVLFNILFNDFQSKAVYDPVEKEYLLKIPRYFRVMIDKYIFTLPSAVIIRLTENGVIDIKFEDQIYDTLFPVETNYIEFNLLKINQEETYLNFKLKLPEIDLEAVEIPVEKSKLFRNTITYNPKRHFYAIQAYYYEDDKWKDMLITHTDQVYDIYTPTCIVKVFESNNTIEYYIPPVYVNTSRLGSKVKFVIYTTNGAINVNFSDYKLGDFSNEYNPVFTEVELDNYTAPLQLVSKVIYLTDTIIDGKMNISFDELKKNVIDNSIGDRKLPITNKQLEFDVNQNNFRLIKSVDVVTDRIFYLESKIPNAKTRYPITKFNLDIIEYRTTINQLRNNNKIISINNEVTLIPEGTLFEIDDNGLRILTVNEADQLNSLSGINRVTEMNSHTYLSTFYHYVLDTSNNRTTLNAYDLTSPIVDRINFKQFNATARVGINTSTANLYRTNTGYTLDILCNLKQYVGTIDQTNIKPYILYSDIEGSRFYLEGKLHTLIEKNPVYRFEFHTQLNIDSNNRIYITNFVDNNNTEVSISVGLNSQLQLVYLSNIIPANYKATEMEETIYGSFLAVGNVVVTSEELTVTFGVWLERLMRRIHSSVTNGDYLRYTENIPLRHKATVYNESNEIVHQLNDIVVDENGEPYYEHVIGDVVIDEEGNPVNIPVNDLTRYINLLFIDSKTTVSDKITIKNYRNDIRKHLTEKITENAVVVQNELLEKTESYVVVPKNIDNVTVKTPSRVIVIPSMQSFVVNVFVNDRIFGDTVARDSIEHTIIKTIDEYLYEHTWLSKTELLSILYSLTKEYVNSISLEKFTELNEEYIEILDSNSRIGLNKILVYNADGFDLREDISVNFLI